MCDLAAAADMYDLVAAADMCDLAAAITTTTTILYSSSRRLKPHQRRSITTIIIAMITIRNSCSSSEAGFIEGLGSSFQQPLDESYNSQQLMVFVQQRDL
jgi:hypothetical protein